MFNIIRTSGGMISSKLVIACFLLIWGAAVFGDSDKTRERLEITVDDDAKLEIIEELHYQEYIAGARIILTDGSHDMLDPASVTWVSDNPVVAEVKDNGGIVPHREGIAVIKASYQGIEGNIEVKVVKSRLTTLGIKEQNLVLYQFLNGPETQNPVILQAVARSASGKNYEVTLEPSTLWTSSDGSVASVSGGLLYAKGPGQATVTAGFAGLRAETVAVVKEARVVGIRIDSSEIVLQGVSWCEMVPCIAVLADGSEVDASGIAQYISSDPSVATACAGRIDAVGEGQTTVKISLAGFYDNVKVTIQPSPPNF